MIKDEKSSSWRYLGRFLDANTDKIKKLPELSPLLNVIELNSGLHLGNVKKIQRKDGDGIDKDRSRVLENAQGIWGAIKVTPRAKGLILLNLVGKLSLLSSNKT